MKLNYYSETDSLYIDLSGRPGSESKEISEGVVLDYDPNGRLVGIDIDNASHKVELKKLILNTTSEWYSEWGRTTLTICFHSVYMPFTPVISP